MHSPGPLLASGREADIFEYGPGLVLRRSREGRPMHAEARAMQHAHDHGYPVPAVEEISGDGLSMVMERVDGPSMVAAMSARPWTVGRNADALADLHQRLHAIDGPDWLRPAPVAAGTSMVHCDLHPLNVIVTKRGPMVIDWSGASRGDPATDVAITWVLSAAGQVPTNRVWGAVLSRFRGLFVNRFLSHFDLAELRAQLRGVVEWKVGDPHMSEREIGAMRALAEG